MLKARLFPSGWSWGILFFQPTQWALVLFGFLGAAAMLCPGGSWAADIEATLFPGPTITNSASVKIPAQSPNADVLFSFDVTGSMMDVLDLARSNAVSLMTALNGTGVGYRFAVSSFGDYPATYNSCGYSNTYGGSFTGMASDYPYRLDQPMTANALAVSTAIDKLALTPGIDGPESYTRALYESFADANLQWRTGAKRVMVNFGDSVPHDCNINAGTPWAGAMVYSTGGDPGRDALMGTADDLELLPVLDAMATNHIVLLAARMAHEYAGTIYPDYYFEYWTNWTARTGGKAFQTSSGTLIADLMHEITNSTVITCVSNLHLVVEPASFNSWLTAAPATYSRICAGETADFQLALSVPWGAPAGDYSFTVRMVDEQNVEFLSKSVLLHVWPTVSLPVALNNNNLAWTTPAGQPWFGQTNLSHDHAAAGRSFFIRDNQQSRLTVQTNGPGTLSFWWKVSSQTNADLLTFSSSGGGVTNSLVLSGEVDWKQQSFFLPAGSQTLTWAYAKDSNGSAGLDAGFLDQVTYTFGGTKPFITTQPQSQIAPATTPLSFTVEAYGTPALAYQWLYNGVALSGQTGATLSVSSSQVSDNGTYQVIVTNAYGAVTSAVASLTVVMVIADGDNSLNQLDVNRQATNVVSIAAGAWHSLALRQDGSVLAWGQNYSGETDVPAGLHDAMGIAAGGYHNLALRLDGTVRAWGDNGSGQTNVPAGLSNVTAVAAGTWHSLALRANGTVVAWGDNTLGQIDIPSGLSNVVAIAAGGNHSLALRADGTVVAWGENTDEAGNWAGQSVVPWGLSQVVAIGAGDFHSLAVKQNGSVVAWGDNGLGQATPPASLTNAVAVVGGGSHSVALRANGTVVGWGNNWNGQCSFPSTVTNVTAIAAGNSHTLLLVGSGAVRPQLQHPIRKPKQFSLLAQTLWGKHYTLEYQTNLTASAWVAVGPTTNLPGNGGVQLLTDPSATNATRYYRVRVW